MTTSELDLQQQLVVCQQIAKLVRARLPLAGELGQSSVQTSAKVRESLQTIDDRLASGQSLASAVASGDDPNSRVLAACIESGELSGSLDHSLESWAAMHIANHKASRAMRNALVYPLCLILVTLCSLSFVIWILIPQYRETYTLFDQQMPAWLSAIVWAREHIWLPIACMLLSASLPLIYWFWRRRRTDASGQPLEPSKQLRLQALASDAAARLLSAGVPLNRIAFLATRAGGAASRDAEQAFERLVRQATIVPIARESSMLLSSVHAGLLTPQDAAEKLRVVAGHLRDLAQQHATRQARWIPMLVAVTVGCLTILTYVFLIYLPWVWLMQKIVAPSGATGL